MRRKLEITRWDGGVTKLPALFNRIPDDVVLAVSARDLNLWDPYTCLCGWVVRESLAQAAGIDADQQSAHDIGINYTAAERFGGSYRDWANVFNGVTQSDKVAIIEEAWTRRVMKAAKVLS